MILFQWEQAVGKKYNLDFLNLKMIEFYHS